MTKTMPEQGLCRIKNHARRLAQCVTQITGLELKFSEQTADKTIEGICAVRAAWPGMDFDMARFLAWHDIWQDKIHASSNVVPHTYS